MNRIGWSDSDAVEFHLPHGEEIWKARKTG
jgi:hypothetical protein